MPIQPQTHAEIAKASKIEKSNLSETAQFVNKIMSTYITPKMREQGLMNLANEIFAEKLSAGSPQILEFSLKARQLEKAILETAKDIDAKGIAVINNYFNKLLKNIRTVVV